MAVGRAKLAIDRGLSVWVLEAPDGFGDAQLHAHHAIQLTACHDGDLTIVGEGGAVSAPGIAVAADARGSRRRPQSVLDLAAAPAGMVADRS